MFRALLISAILGALMPLGVLLGLLVANQAAPVTIELGDALYTAVLLVWPTSLLAMAPAGVQFNNVTSALLFSIGANAALYAVLGSMVWYGLFRNRWLLIIPAALEGYLFWIILTLETTNAGV